MGKEEIMKLHLGCGTQRLDDYINIDIQQRPENDMTCDVKKLPFGSGTIDEILAYHLLEHLYPEDAERCLEIHWHRLLKLGGKLVLEMPDMDRIMTMYVKGEYSAEQATHLTYGAHRNEYDSHLWGYTPESTTRLLKACGYKNIKTSDGTDYHAKESPAFRIEATK